MDNLMHWFVFMKKKDLGLNLNIVFMEFPGSWFTSGIVIKYKNMIAPYVAT